MEVIYPRCAGLDVHKRNVTASRIRPGEGSDIVQETKTFETMTPDLLELLDWLLEWGVTHVSMESTSVYWKPIFNVLEGHLEVILVNARHVKHVPGRKTDVKDAEWLAQLLRVGLLKASFIPDAPQRDLRDLTRYRTKLVQERAREINRVQKILEDANIKLASVATDVFGKSGRAMLVALAAGEGTPQEIADLAKGRLRSKVTELERALTGVMRDHHRYILQQQLTHISFLDEQIEGLSTQIDQRLAQIPWDKPSSDQPSPPAPDNEPDSGELPLTAVQVVELLKTVNGISDRTAATIIAEIGTDMSQFPTDEHLASWAGVVPGNHQSAGKRKSGRTPPGNKTLQAALNQAAWAAVRCKGTYLSEKYRRLAHRRGKKRAIVAVMRSMLVSVYHMLSKGEPYHDLGADYLNKRRKENTVNHFVKKIKQMGYSVHVEPLPAASLATA